MFSFQDIVKYIGIAAIVFFLIKAFASNGLDNKQVLFLVVAIMLIMIFLLCQKDDCKKKSLNEAYEITDPPIVDSIYPGPDNTEYRAAKLLPMPPAIDYTNQDLLDQENIMGIDKKTLKALKRQERKAQKNIRNHYRDEMVFTTTNPINTVPLGTQLYGYTYLPPENWFRGYNQPPVCITDKKCPVCPVLDDSKTSDLLQFDASNNLIGAEGIDLRYIKKIINRSRRNQDELRSE
jgi:hypothetical protein